MNAELITRLVKLIEKTGDRVILPDIETGRAVVVMDLDAYERLASMDSSERSVSNETTPPEKAPEASGIVAPPVERPAASIPPSAPEPSVRASNETVQRSPFSKPPEALPVIGAAVEEPPSTHRHDPVPPVTAPVVAPEAPSMAIPGENKGKNRGLTDLTQEELLDRINRDIDDWKTAQDARRTDELRSAVHGLELSESPSDQLEEEERFFLEPIE